MIHPDDLGEQCAEEAGDQRRVLLGISHQQTFELGKIKLVLVGRERLKVPSGHLDQNLR